MSTQRRTGRIPTVAAKRNAASSENVAVGKVSVGAPPPVPAAKKRPPLGNLTNQRRSGTSSSSMVPCAVTKVVKTKKGYSTSVPNSSGNVMPALLNAKSNVIPNSSGNVMPTLLDAKSNVSIPRSSDLPKSNESTVQIDTSDSDTCVDMDISSPPSPSGGLSVSADESISTTDSMKSPDVEYLDENDLAAVNSIQRKTFGDLHITDQIATAGALCKRDILSEIETADNVVNLDVDMEDPQLCASFACDIYKHLRASETKKRPSTDFMEKVQQDINASMRSILIDWLVEVAEEYRLVPDTLYLTVNYIDRYLSGNSVNRQRLQLLGIACMMIASKYEEICAPQVEEYCYITDNTYFKEEVLQMESTVLNYLKFEMTAPTIKCFLRRFVRAAQASNEASPMQLECLANYIAELSLLEYHMLQYVPSITAASAIFLAKYILAPSKRPWNSTLQHYTLYQPSQLQECVRALYKLCLNNGHNSSLPAIREKYSQHKYKFVAKKYCPPTIPPEYFYNVISSNYVKQM